jgi:uncharacterized membrane protein (DUF106 family)
MGDYDLVWKERYEQLKAEIPKLVEEARRQAYREAMEKLEGHQQTIAQLKDERQS